MRKQIFTLVLGICAVCGFAQTQLTTEMSQQELASVYKNENGVLSRTIEIPVKYGAYDLTKFSDLFTRVVVYNYLVQEFNLLRNIEQKYNLPKQGYPIWERMYFGGVYNDPLSFNKEFDCGKVSQTNQFLFTTRPGYVSCTIVLGDYYKSSFLPAYGKYISPQTLYPYTDKDKKWASKSFVSNYNQSEEVIRKLFEKPISLGFSITPTTVNDLVYNDKLKSYHNKGYFIFDYGQEEKDNREEVYALHGNRVLHLDFKTGEEKVLYTAELDECDEPLIRAFNGNMYVVFEDVGDAIVPDAVKFYYPNGDLVYQCSTVIFDDEGRHITVANAKDVTTKNKKTGKTKTVRKGVYSSCSYDEFPNGLVEQPATLKKGMKVNDVLKFIGAEGIIKEGGTAFHVEVTLVIKYNGKTYKTNVWAGGLGSLGSPYADGSYSDEKWHEQMWSLQVPSAFSDDAVIK